MKTYKNIYFTINSRIEVVLKEIESLLKNGWWRDQEAEQDFKRISSSSDAASYYFHCDKRGERWAATIILTKEDENKYWLSHVLPIEDSPNPFSHDQFNQLADEFYDSFLLPLEESGSIFTLNFDGEVDLEVELGQDLYQLLSTFSKAANKSTGSCHPCDRERWFDFITAISNSEVELNAPLLERWLIEKESWSDEVASELSSEYEFGIDLLKHYKG